VGVELRLFGDVAEPNLESDGIVNNGLAMEQNLAFARVQKAGDDLYGGAFAGAIWAQLSENLTGANLKADIVEGR
jgi:hypothetical protein